MPLIYQGRLIKKTVATAGAALRLGKKRLGDTEVSRIDARLCWESPDALVACEQYLPSESKIFWMDVAAHADADTLPLVPAWLESLQRGHVSLICLKEGFETEVRITLPGMPPERYDHDNYEARFGYDSRQMVIKSLFMPSAKGMSKEQRSYAASRVRACFDQLCALTHGEQPTYADWVRANSPETDIGRGFLEASTPPIAPAPFQVANPTDSIPLAEVTARATVVTTCPTDFVIETNSTHANWAHHLWAKLITMLPQVDVLVIRCGGPRKGLMQVLDQLDLYHYHPHRNNHQFGISTLHEDDALHEESLGELVNSKKTGRAIADWDVKWSGLRFEIEAVPKQPLGQSSSYYLIRSDSARSLDRLLLSLDCEDPTAPEFRSARRQLAAEFSDLISRESSWEYVGVPLNSPLGRRYTDLTSQLQLARIEAIETSNELPAYEGNRWLDSLPRPWRKKAAKTSFVQQMQNAITAALPGFKFDRKAHVTDRYFVEYVRRIVDGYQVIQVKRHHEPSGFQLRFAVTQYRIPFEDLISSMRYSVPGCVVEMNALIPERPDGWLYGSERSLERQLTDLTEVLAVRARLFFSRSERALREHSVDHNEDNS
jgi:hypothetical protein